MQARDWFGVALRVLGVWFLVQAGNEILFVFVKIENLANSTVPVGQTKFFAAYWLLVAFVLLLFADHIVQLVYGPNSKRAEDDNPPPAQD